jgi:thiosulfate reductase cytochrome b subunit
MKMRRIYIFKGFERFWHWAQALLILAMILTGFEIHGSWQLLGFEQAVHIHEFSAWSLIVLWVFAIFWHFTTGEWRQYIPSTKNLGAMIRYYGFGIFNGEDSPFKQTLMQKHNPLQRMAYLALKLFLNPLMWITGLLMLFYADWGRIGIEFERETVVLLHVAGAFLMTSFLIMHLYLITTGHTVGSHLKAMITGYEEVED